MKIGKYETHPACDLFPLLDEARLNELAEDIKRQGLLQDVTLFEGQILDGRNRLLACERAGVAPRFTEWTGAGSPTTWVLSVNLHRRHLDESQRAMVGAKAKPLFEADIERRKKLLGLFHAWKQYDKIPVDWRRRGFDCPLCDNEDAHVWGENEQFEYEQGQFTEPDYYEEAIAHRSEVGICPLCRTNWFGWLGDEEDRVPQNLGEPTKHAGESAEKAAHLVNVSRSSVESAAKVLKHGAPALISAVESGKVAVSTAAVIADAPKAEQAQIVARHHTEKKSKEDSMDPFYSNTSRRSANMLGEEFRRYEARIAALREALEALKIRLNGWLVSVDVPHHNAVIDAVLKADAAMARGDEPSPNPAA